MTIFVNDIAPSVQGEGEFAGVPIVILRLMTCNLKCSFKDGGFDCDTYYTWDKDRLGTGRHMTAEEILNEIVEYSSNVASNVVMLTGGEPLLWQNNREFNHLLRLLRSLNYSVHVETNGTIKPTRTTLDLIDVFAISPKHKQYPNRYTPESFLPFEHTHHFFKFVVGKFIEKKGTLFEFLAEKEVPRTDLIFIMPMGGTPEEIGESILYIIANQVLEKLKEMGYTRVFMTGREQIEGGFK